MMPVLAEKLHAKAVDRAEERAVKRSQNIERDARVEDALARALLHLVGGAIGESDDDERGQQILGARVAGDGGDAIGDGARLAAASRCDDGKISIKVGDEAVALRLIDRRFHWEASLNAGWVCSHFCSSTSSSMASVASG